MEEGIGPFAIATDGQPVFGALVKPLKNGGIQLCIILDDKDDGPFIEVNFEDEKGLLVATRLEREVGIRRG